MWRVMLVAVAAGVLAGACAEGLSPQEEFVKIMEKTREGTFTVTFDFDAPDGSREPITWYRMGEWQRTDVDVAPRVSPVTEGYRLTWVSGPQGTYVCSEIASSMTRDLAGCVREPTVYGVPFPAGPPAFLLTSISRPDFLDVRRVETRTIVGGDVRCFGIEATDGEGGELNVCLMSDGVPLYIELVVAVEGSFTYTANVFSTEVPEGIFLPPMEIVGENPICAQLAC